MAKKKPVPRTKARLKDGIKSDIRKSFSGEKSKGPEKSTKEINAFEKRKRPTRRNLPKDWSKNEETVDEELARQQELLAKLNGVGGFALLDDDEVETLLDVPNRKDLLIEPGSPLDLDSNHKLVRIVQDRPHQYKRFLQFLREGAEPLAACLATDIATPKTVKEWSRQGVLDNDKELDTYYSRFYRDMLRAIAARAVEVQNTISIDDPKLWLRNGPGRMISDMWRDDPSSKSTKNITVDERKQVEVSVNRIPDAEILRPEAHIIDAEVVEETVLPFDQNDYKKALDLLQSITSKDNNIGLISALKFQAGEEMSEEEIEEFAATSDPLGGQTLGSCPKLLTEQLRNAESSC